MGLGSGALAAVAYWNVQQLVRADEPVERVVFYFALYSTAGALVWMLPQTWHPVTWSNAGSLAGVAILGTIGQVLLTQAYGKGRPLVSAALSYSGIVFSAVLGMVVFGDRAAAPVLARRRADRRRRGSSRCRCGSTRRSPAPQVTND